MPARVPPRGGVCPLRRGPIPLTTEGLTCEPRQTSRSNAGPGSASVWRGHRITATRSPGSQSQAGNPAPGQRQPGRRHQLTGYRPDHGTILLLHRGAVNKATPGGKVGERRPPSGVLQPSASGPRCPASASATGHASASPSGVTTALRPARRARAERLTATPVTAKWACPDRFPSSSGCASARPAPRLRGDQPRLHPLAPRTSTTARHATVTGLATYHLRLLWDRVDARRHVSALPSRRSAEPSRRAVLTSATAGPQAGHRPRWPPWPRRPSPGRGPDRARAASSPRKRPRKRPPCCASLRTSGLCPRWTASP